jgi:hypothetical protein
LRVLGQAQPSPFGPLRKTLTLAIFYKWGAHLAFFFTPIPHFFPAATAILLPVFFSSSPQHAGQQLVHLSLPWQPTSRAPSLSSSWREFPVPQLHGREPLLLLPHGSAQGAQLFPFLPPFCCPWRAGAFPSHGRRLPSPSAALAELPWSRRSQPWHPEKSPQLEPSALHCFSA